MKTERVLEQTMLSLGRSRAFVKAQRARMEEDIQKDEVYDAGAPIGVH
jgi:hypothetical protein